MRIGSSWQSSLSSGWRCRRGTRGPCRRAGTRSPAPWWSWSSSNAEMKDMSEVVSTVTGRIIETLAERGDVVSPGQPLAAPRSDRTHGPGAGGRHLRLVRARETDSRGHGGENRSGVGGAGRVRLPDRDGDLRVGLSDHVASHPANACATPSWVAALSRGDAPYEIRADLQLDPDTASGYRWSSSAGPPSDILTGTLCAARITVERRRPVEMVLPLLREQLGV